MTSLRTAIIALLVLVFACAGLVSYTPGALAQEAGSSASSETVKKKKKKKKKRKQTYKEMMAAITTSNMTTAEKIAEKREALRTESAEPPKLVTI